MKEVRIKGVSCISAQTTDYGRSIPLSPVSYSGNRLKALEPDYSNYVNPAAARRMGRVIKMGLAASETCLNDGNIGMPDAIVVGTALGCLSDTEKFLVSVIRDKEQFLTPTHFIQSLQNTVAAQIALKIGCKGHNYTFAHKGFSFESALIDAMMLLNEGSARNVLVGGLDELTDYNYIIYKKLGYWKPEEVDSLQLLQSTTKGTIGGEGAAFFALGNEEDMQDYAILREVICLKDDDDNHPLVGNAILSALESRDIALQDVSLVLMGRNGCNVQDRFYDHLESAIFNQTPCGHFKNLCGEYQTAAAFATWLAARMLKEEVIPEFIGCTKEIKKLRRVLVCNKYENNVTMTILDSTKSIGD